MVLKLDDPQIFSLALKDVYIPSDTPETLTIFTRDTVASKQTFREFLDGTVVRFYLETNNVLLLCMQQAYLFENLNIDIIARNH